MTFPTGNHGARSGPRPLAGSRNWYEVKAAAGGEVAVYIYDEIGIWGVDAASLVREIDAVDAATINVRINSPGGDVFGGMAIANALSRHRARVVVDVDGVAASIASVIAMSGDEIRMAKNAMLMIHRAWSGAIGNSNDMRKMAEVLDQIDESMAEVYCGRTGKDRDEVIELMDGETWFRPDAALEAGFIDEVGEPVSAKAHNLTKFGYRKVPDGLGARRAEASAPPERDLERTLRDAGFSKRVAAAAVAAAKAEAARSDSGPAEWPDELVSAVAILTESIRKAS